MSPLSNLARTALRSNETFVPIGEIVTEMKAAKSDTSFADGLWPLVLKYVAPLWVTGMMAGAVYRMFVGF